MSTVCLHRKFAKVGTVSGGGRYPITCENVRFPKLASGCGGDVPYSVTMPLLNERAKEVIAEYNRNPRCAKRYNPAAEMVYRARRKFGDPLLQEFEPYVITGLKN